MIKQNVQVRRAVDRYWLGWRGIVETQQNHATLKGSRDGEEQRSSKNVPQGKWVSKGECEERRENSKRGPRQSVCFTKASLICITFAGASVACPFLSSKYSSHHNLIFFFNEIGQLDKGQMTELKQISRGLARGSFIRTLKAWASTNRTDESVGEKKYEKDKERVHRCYYSVTDDTYKEVHRNLLINSPSLL